MECVEQTLCPQKDDTGRICGAIATILDRYGPDSFDDNPDRHGDWAPLVKVRCKAGHFLMCMQEEFVEPDFDLVLSRNDI